MAEPTLGELTHLGSESGLGTGAPAVILDNRDLVHTLNSNAQFKAQNDWNKYTTFQNNLKEVFRDVDSIADIETMEQDKAELKRRTGDVLKKIMQNPHGFFSGKAQNFTEIQGELARIKSDAVASKQNNVFDQAHRQYILRDPSLNTEENKKIIENYSKQPLGKRQPYMLNLPGMFDPAVLGKQLNELTKSVKPYTRFTPDNKFIESGTETSYDPDKWNKIAESLYNMQDERGNLLRNTVQQRFSQLPPEVQAQYNKEADPAKAFYMTSLEPFRLQNSATDKTVKDNPFELQQQKARDKVDELKTKHGFDIELENKKISGRKEVEKTKEELKGQTKKQQFGYLNKLVDGQVNTAISDPNKLVSNPDGSPVPKYQMEVSTPVLHTFGYSTGSGVTKSTTDADDMLVDGDGKIVTVVFYQRDKNDKIVHDKEGNPIVDKNKTKDFSKEEYKAIVGKELLGVSGSLKSLNTEDEEDEDEEESVNKGGNSDKVEYGGKKFTSAQIEKAAKQSGMTVAEYKKALGL